MHASRRYAVPETRLPFVNAEVAQVDVNGTPHLVSSVWGGHDNGRLYFWNPESGAHFMRRLPSPIPGAYMLKTGADGNLYLGCGNGDLLRYDGRRDAFESLVSGHLRGITWGGAVTRQFVFWNAFHGDCNGSVAVYDLEQGRVVHTFAPLDTGRPPGLYGHQAVIAPDGRIIWHLDVPSARVVVIDPASMERVAIERPWLAAARASTSVFLDSTRLVVFTTRGAFLVRYPEFELETELDMPPACRAGANNYAVLLNGALYTLARGSGDLWRMDTASLQWVCAVPAWTQGDYAVLSVWRDRDIGAVTLCGLALRYEPDTGKTSTLDLEATGVLPVHAFCAVPRRRRIVGAPFINQRFWTIDLDTGEGLDRGRAAPGGGQINQIVWDEATGRALLSSYTSASVTAYNPDAPGAWPVNPCLLASAHDQGQMRPLALVHDGRHVWMGTNPEYGTLGGALCRIDPVSGEIRIWRNLVPDQGVIGIAVDPARRRLFFATTIQADCGSASPTQSTAVAAVFDMDRLAVTACRPAEPAAPAVHLLAVLPDGRALLCQGDRIMAWQPEDDRLEPWGWTPDQFRGLLISPDGTPVALTSHGIGIMQPSAADGGQYRYNQRIDEGAAAGQIAGDDLYYVVGLEIVCLPLDRLI